MSIGLLDYDMYNYKLFPFNLEIMKLAAYYKQHNELVSLSPGFYPDNYTKLYIRKDTLDDKQVDNFVGYNNIDYGGYYFSNGLYIPLPLDIELTAPDPSIYNKVKPEFQKTKNGRAQWKKQYGSHFVRLSLNNRTVWDDYLKSSRFDRLHHIVSIQDFNVTKIQDSYPAIKEVINMYRKNQYTASIYLNFKFPVQVDNEEQFIKWYKLNDGKRSMSSFQWNGLITDEFLVEIVEKYNKGIVNGFYYNVCLPDNLSDEKFLEYILKIFNQVVFLKQNSIFFSLIIGTNFPNQEQWQKVFDLWNCWLRTAAQRDKPAVKNRIEQETLYGFCVLLAKASVPKKGKKNRLINPQVARDAFAFIGNNYPILFEYFYHLVKVNIQGGNFVCTKMIYPSDLILNNELTATTE